MSGLWNRIRAKFARRPPAPKAGYPTVSARVSVDDADTFTAAIAAMAQDFFGLAARIPFQLYEVIDDLVLFEPYFSKYHQTTIALGNTGHSLEIAAPNEARAREAIQAANEFAARCFPFGGGLDGLINGLFSQIARSGGLCVEWAPSASLVEIEEAFLVQVRSIRFRRAEDGSLELCQLQNGQLVMLNAVQTTFHIANRYDENPYPIPPTIAGLRAAVKLKRIDQSLDGWLQKLGALGLLIGSMTPPERELGETQEAYDIRATTYIEKVAGTIIENLKGGLALSYDNLQFKFQNTNAGAAGAKDVLQMVLQSLFAGLQRDPVFFGWNFNSTETFAKVVFEEMLGGIMNSQLGVKRAIEHGHRLNLALVGFGDVGVSAKFHPNRSLDAFMHSEAEQMRSMAVVSQYEAGLISEEEARKKLGYGNEPPTSGSLVQAENMRDLRHAAFNARTKQYELAPYRARLHRGGSGLPTASQSGPNLKKEARILRQIRVLKHAGRQETQVAREYLWKVRRMLSDAGRIGVDAVYSWAITHDVPYEEEFVAGALQRFIDGAEGSIDEATLVAMAKDHIGKIWATAKADDLLFPDWDRAGRGVAVVMGEADNAAIDYLSKKVDRFYVSKYVSNSPQRSEQITRFLQRQYLEQGLGRGKSPKELGMFREQFGDLAERIGNHGARIIIDTGVARAQNWAQVFQLSDAKITEFKISGPNDRLTCRYCRSMLGRVFKTETERQRIEQIIEGGEEDIRKFHPFITSRYGTKAGLEALKGASDVEVQASGMVAPPFHCLCRHGMVAEIK